MFTGEDKLVSVKSQGNLNNNNNNNSSKVLMVKQVIRNNTSGGKIKLVRSTKNEPYLLNTSLTRSYTVP